MTRVTINPATLRDVTTICEHKGYSDIHTKVLREYMKRSLFSWTGLIDGEVACVWGLIAPTMLSDQAYLWLTTTDLMDEHPFCLVRHSQIVMQDMLRKFPIIVGHVVEEQSRSVRWLRWLGVSLGRHVDGLIEFELRAHG